MIAPTNTRLTAIVSRPIAERVADFARARKWSISTATAALINEALETHDRGVARVQDADVEERSNNPFDRRPDPAAVAALRKVVRDGR